MTDPRLKNIPITTPVMGYLFAIKVINEAIECFCEPGANAIPESLRNRRMTLASDLKKFRKEFLEALDAEVCELITQFEKQTAPSIEELQEFFRETIKQTPQDAHQGAK